MKLCLMQLENHKIPGNRNEEAYLHVTLLASWAFGLVGTLGLQFNVFQHWQCNQLIIAIINSGCKGHTLKY